MSSDEIRVQDLTIERKRIMLAEILRLKADTSRTYPLSYQQEDIWLADQLEGGSSAWNVSAGLEITGKIEVPQIDRCLQTLFDRHDALRAVFPLLDNRPAQQIREGKRYVLQVEDLSALAADARHAAVDRLAEEILQQPFDLNEGPLFRFAVVRTHEDRHILLTSVHHIVFDGWSLGLFFKEFGALYLASSMGMRASLAPLPIRHVDYCIWQRTERQDMRFEADLCHWMAKLAAPMASPELPGDRSRASNGATSCGRRTWSVPEDLASQIRELCKENDTTAFVALCTALKVLLRHYTDEDDMVMGMTTAGRNRRETHGLIGCLANLVVLRTDLSGDPSFRDLLKRVRTTCLDALAHDQLPYGKLVKALREEPGRSRAPLFRLHIVQVDFVPLPEDGGLGFAMKRLDLFQDQTSHDISFMVKDAGSEMSLMLRYSAELFDAAQMDRLLADLEIVLTGAIQSPNTRISELCAELEPWRGSRPPSVAGGFRPGMRQRVAVTR